MVEPQTLFSGIVADFARLRSAYEKAGLIDGTAKGSPSWKLLGGEEDVRRFQRKFLLLDAVVRHRVAKLVRDGGDVRHVAVFGGNNVGKSTVVNILAQQVMASASPEGGHTRHAHGFVREIDGLFGRNDDAFRGFKAIVDGKIPAGRFDVYTLSRLDTDALPPDVAIWDTPDCDAVGSARYVGSVVEAAAAADVIVYVTSVDKYAVADLVEWVFQLNDAGIPIIECLNKTPKKDRDTVILKQGRDIFPAMAAQLDLPVFTPTIAPLRMLIDADDESDLWAPAHVEAGALRQTVVDALDGVDRHRAGLAAIDCVSRHVGDLVDPVRLEVEARQHWTVAVEDAVKTFVASYEHEYLASSTTNEPIARLSLEILHLLDPDIRGLKQAMSAIRWVTRWPSKLLIATGRYVYYRVFPSSTPVDTVPPELKAYSNAHSDLLNGLSARIRTEQKGQRHHPFWDTLDEEWMAQQQSLSERFSEQVKAHMTRTEEEIKAAARDIFEQLQQRPTTLNMLRAARVAADVGGVLVGIILPVKGGYVYDLVEEGILAPAMVSATEAATTAGVDVYVSRRKEKILDKLKAEARDIGRTLYREPLLALAEQAMTRAGALGIDKDLIERLPRSLATLRTELSDHAA